MRHEASSELACTLLAADLFDLLRRACWSRHFLPPRESVSSCHKCTEPLDTTVRFPGTTLQDKFFDCRRSVLSGVAKSTGGVSPKMVDIEAIWQHIVQLGYTDEEERVSVPRLDKGGLPCNTSLFWTQHVKSCKRLNLGEEVGPLFGRTVSFIMCRSSHDIEWSRRASYE